MGGWLSRCKDKSNKTRQSNDSASDSVSASPECRAVRCHFSSLAVAIADPLRLSMDLFSKEIIEEVTMEEANLPQQTKGDKNRVLLSAVMRRVEARPSLFYQFVDILKDSGDYILRELGEKLQTTYSQYLQQSTSLPLISTQQVHSPPPPTATHSSLLPPPVRRYADYLRAFYQTSELPATDKWPPSPSETFINLAVISREKVNRKDMEKFMLATLHGGVDQIIDIKAPIEIKDILNLQSGKTLQCVLVEGAPGVGKTTLAWEACKQWGKGVLFQQFAIVMLLRLRDQTVQNAQSISDLVFYHRNREEIAHYLDDIDGRQILIILEGLDELPTHLLMHSSIFTDLLSGEKLPHATILVTSRPSATVHLWNNWKHRISRHIEVLGFTQENITQYMESVLSPQELYGFQNYLSINPHIMTIMYIPLHAAIVIEVYRMCQDSSRTLPTTITELYTCFMQTVLLRYIMSQPDYKGEQVDLQKFTNLPSPVYDLFYKLAQLAYNGVIDKQLIFKHQQHTIQHLGFMDAVTELFPNQLAVTYSYNFLHLSIQEYLAAYYVSTMEIPQQEQLLQRMCTEIHLQNMGRFLAGITKFSGMDKAIVKKAIGEGYKGTKEIPLTREMTRLSTHTLQLLYECGDASILDSNEQHVCLLTDHNPLFDFSTLGYCITRSNCKWTVSLGTSAQPMKSIKRIKTLIQALNSHSNSSHTYHIVGIYCYYDDPECVEQLLAMQENVYLRLEGLVLMGNSEKHQPLPQCVPELIPTMSNLLTLGLMDNAGTIAMHRTIQAANTLHKLHQLSVVGSDIDHECVTTLCQWLSTSSRLKILGISLPSPDAINMISTALTTNSTLNQLNLERSKFNIRTMQAMCFMLTANNSINKVWLCECHIDDDIIYSLAKNLHSNNTITHLDISRNSISDRGAVCVADMLKINNTLQDVDLTNNYIGIKGQVALKKIEETKKHIKLCYTPQY